MSALSDATAMFSDDSSISSPTPRVVLLGASNLTLAFPLIVNSIRHSFQGPVELFAAHGHGRSFCQWSHVLHRGLPSILECDLWEALATRPAAKRTWGLVTDIGNDLLYGRTPDETAKQVGEAMERLVDQGAALTFVRPPLERILQLSDRRYRVTKRLLFPGPVTPWKEMSKRIVELDAAVQEFAQGCGASVITPDTSWYGVDPIHVRRRSRSQAWRMILETWAFEEPVRMHPASAMLARRLWSCAPAERTLWGKRKFQEQPVWRMEDGPELWLY